MRPISTKVAAVHYGLCRTTLLRDRINRQVRRTCPSRISVGSSLDADSFSETHHQYFHSADCATDYLTDAGFGEMATSAEYAWAPVTTSMLRATWIARLQRSTSDQ